MDLLRATQYSFMSGKVPNCERVHVTVTKFKGSAVVWWHILINRRSQMGEPLIEDWHEMKRGTRNAFLPYHYKQRLHVK